MSNVENQIHHYTFALYSLYEEENKDFLKDIHDIFTSFYHNKEIIEILSSNNLSKQERKKIIKTIFDKKINEYLINFLYVLIDNSFIHNVLFIIQDFFTFYNREKNISFLKIITPFTLEDKVIQKIVESHKKRQKKEIVYTVEIDKSLIGGFKLVYNDHYILDYSIKGKINNLRSQIKTKKEE